MFEMYLLSEGALLNLDVDACFPTYPHLMVLVL